MNIKDTCFKTKKEAIVWDGKCENTRQRLNIEIIKEDVETGKKLAGVEFALTGEDGKLIRKAVSDKTGLAVFYDLPAGRYTVRETKAPEGYALGTAFGPVFDLAYDASGAEVMTWKSVCGDSKIQLTSEPTPAPKNSSAPKTGDKSSPLIWLLIAAAAMSATLAAVSRLRGKKNPPEKEGCA